MIKINETPVDDFIDRIGKCRCSTLGYKKHQKTIDSYLTIKKWLVTRFTYRIYGAGRGGPNISDVCPLLCPNRAKPHVLQLQKIN